MSWRKIVPYALLTVVAVSIVARRWIGVEGAMYWVLLAVLVVALVAALAWRKSVDRDTDREE